MKNKSFHFTICLMGVLNMTSIAQENTFRRINDGIIVSTEALNVKVQFYAPNIVRIEKWPFAGTAKKTSLSVIMKEPPATKIKIQIKNNLAELSSGKLKTVVSLVDGKVEFLDPNGTEILNEDTVGFTPVVYDRDSSFDVLQKFDLTAGEGDLRAWC